MRNKKSLQILTLKSTVLYRCANLHMQLCLYSDFKYITDRNITTDEKEKMGSCTFPFNKRLHDGIIHRNFVKIIKAVLRREVGSLRKDFPAI